jgi:hypothetical protein
METAGVMIASCIGFSGVAALTWFFASRPRLFVRVFVPHDELPKAARGILRNPHIYRAMRQMSLFQFAIAAIFGVIGLCLLAI